jgi:predicted NAD-dependent protein-ADP-ribosyltransferase YbiA (DUF1768 family)
MLVQLSDGCVVLQSKDATDGELAAWLATHAGQVFALRSEGDAVILQAIGPRAEACREPLNITGHSPGALALISNFAHTPFVLDGRAYASTEGFWQGLKFPDEADRRRLAALWGSDARDAGHDAVAAEHLHYAGARVRVGAFDHWQLMKRACAAKFEQHAQARAALISTGTRPLVHEVEPDSKNIPGVLMAQIWMQIRARL